MLTITVVRFNDAPVETPTAAEFREAGGTIGRSPECTLVLHDQDRIISRTHAVVSHQSGRYFLRDQGTTVPVILNGRPIGKGREHALVAGDEFRIAGYTLRVDAVRAAQPAAAAQDPLLAALLRGAGVQDLAVPGGLTPELMRDVGAIMRETMRGMLDLLAARAHAKREVRADATVIGANDNNPLKFSPDLDAAVSHLLKPRGQGFMSPQRSLVDARDGLRTHQEGLVAGMQAALASVLARFDPARLEAPLRQSQGSASLLAMNRKARLWTLYEELYEQISREAETDFHFLFGEEFMRAYREKTRTAPRDA